MAVKEASYKLKITSLISGMGDVYFTIPETQLLIALPELQCRNYPSDAPFGIYAYKKKLFILDSFGMDLDTRNICDEDDPVWEKLYNLMSNRITKN